MEQGRMKKLKFSCVDIVISLYLCFMLGVFPLIYKYQYADMGDFKYFTFAHTTIAFVLVLFLLIFASFMLKVKREGLEKWKTGIKIDLSMLDKGVLFYITCTTISFLFSPYKEDILWGAEGWNMGYLSQVLFVLLYYFISRRWKWKQSILWILLSSSAVVFWGAVLHRFDVDFLNIYGDLALEYKVQFLSTMGQSSWYSSFLCTVFPVGLYLFFVTEKKHLRIISGAYSFLAMCSLVTQNTDSAFLSLFFVLLLFFYLSFDGEKERSRFYEILILVFGSFTFVGICQRIFVERMIPLDSMSIFMSQSLLSPSVLLVTVLLYLLGKKKGSFFLLRSNDKEESIMLNRKGFWVVAGGIGVGIFSMILFIVLNSNGFLYTHFGYQNVNNYLHFTDLWGNGRGFAWRYTREVFSDMPFIQKCIGVGPDGYSFYAESVPFLAEKMKAFWGNLILTNAHNEYLTKLVNIGIVGIFSYLFMLVLAVILFIRNRKEQVLLPAFALSTIAYMVHNIFCYEQVCCSPFFYILLGLGANLLNSKNYNYNKIN